MATVAELIEYLETLPQHATVEVAVNVDNNWSSYTSTEELKIPRWIENDGYGYWDLSDNVDFSPGNVPTILLGRT